MVWKRIYYVDSLPQKQQLALQRYRQKLDHVIDCIEQNESVIRLIIKDVEQMFENVKEPASSENNPTKSDVIASDIDKVQVTFKQLYRDWSQEGAIEREMCYKPIIDEITSIFSPDHCRTEDINILVPGAGLGRLAYEIAKRGYSCQGNEFSLFMLFASNFILNKCHGIEIYEMYPWIQQVDNNLEIEHQAAKVKFPDINPADLRQHTKNSKFTMVAGDFLDVYTYANEWDCVATCFFIDCANNIMTFIEKIYKILKPGGVWINIGPLQYHFSASPEENSIEPSFEVIKDIINSVGFKIQKERTGVPTLYSQNPKSMLKYVYESVFFVCCKPDDGSDSPTVGRVNNCSGRMTLLE
ncbi:hypothetical protein AAG570_010613 [Ranatra chinensis]|uniref:carnosine N-methyltransferase n=1 Tax=Ranatra chinensis TaxID=642074 RepID=A0ABD0YN23_9HEMI